MVNDRVAARDFLSTSEKWRFGVVVEKIGKLHYMIELDDGRQWKHHIDQLKPGPVGHQSQSRLDLPFGISNPVQRTVDSPITPSPQSAVQPTTNGGNEAAIVTVESDQNTQFTDFTTQNSNTNVNDTRDETVPYPTFKENVRRSTRERRAPCRLDL